jgi:hypothetical protein
MKYIPTCLHKTHECSILRKIPSVEAENGKEIGRTRSDRLGWRKMTSLTNWHDNVMKSRDVGKTTFSVEWIIFIEPIDAKFVSIDD